MYLMKFIYEIYTVKTTVNMCTIAIKVCHNMLCYSSFIITYSK